MDWHSALGELRARREPAVLVTVSATRGHVPRAAGAKMVVAAAEVHDSIGGGNLEATAVQRARELLVGDVRTPESLTLALSDRAPAEYGVQCCGGEVTLLLEPMPVPPSIAVFGMGHVGWELAHLLSRHPVHLHLIDSRAGQLDEVRLRGLEAAGARARMRMEHAPVPELMLATLPAGTHVLVMTHDHAEDLALCDAALRTDRLGSIGLIGSSAKWTRFRARLGEAGHSADALARIVTPIGLPQVSGKEPEAVALSVAADLIARTTSRSTSNADTRGPATTSGASRLEEKAQVRAR